MGEIMGARMKRTMLVYILSPSLVLPPSFLRCRPEHMSSITGGGELLRKTGKQGTRGTNGRRRWDSQLDAAASQTETRRGGGGGGGRGEREEEDQEGETFHHPLMKITLVRPTRTNYTKVQ